MAHYVMGDIHGEADRFHAMLKKIQFSEDDILILLGDVERGLAIPQKGTLEQLAQQVFRDE